jgi:ribosome recycling factor
MAYDIAEMQKIYDGLKERTDKSVSSFIYEMGLIRAGRANIHILDDVKVEYYGTETPLNQLANITVPEARMILISVWDSSIMKKTEKALVDANLGVTPVNDGKNLRLVFPAPTEERRKELVKEVKMKAENSRVAIRNIRHDALNEVKALEKKKIITEDMSKSYAEDVDKAINSKIADVDKLAAEKETEIMKV